MAKPTLILAPHELEPNRRDGKDGEPFGFRALWFGKKTKFIGQLVGGEPSQMLFFRPKNERAGGNFVLADHTCNPLNEDLRRFTCHPRFYRGAWKLEKDELPELIQNSWGRLFYLGEDMTPANEEDVKWRLFLTASGWAQWVALPVGRGATFQWRDVPAPELTALPPTELLLWLRRDLRDPTGRFALSRQFAANDGSLSRLLWPLTRGTYDEWEHIIRLFTTTRFDLWNSEKPVFVDLFTENGSSDVSRIRVILREPLKVSEPPNLQKFARWTFEFFHPQLNRHLIAQCLEARRWSKDRNFLNMAICVEPPTQHERLEALLQLREWLCDKAAPDETEALLRDG